MAEKAGLSIGSLPVIAGADGQGRGWHRKEVPGGHRLQGRMPAAAAQGVAAQGPTEAPAVIGGYGQSIEARR